MLVELWLCRDIGKQFGLNSGFQAEYLSRQSSKPIHGGFQTEQWFKRSYKHVLTALYGVRPSTYVALQRFCQTTWSSCKRFGRRSLFLKTVLMPHKCRGWVEFAAVWTHCFSCLPPV